MASAIDRRVPREAADRLYTVFSDSVPPPHMLGNWSSWIHVLSMTKHIGFIDSSRNGCSFRRCDWKDLTSEDKMKVNQRGVFELMIRKPQSLNTVVYIGCTNTDNEQSTQSVLSKLVGTDCSDDVTTDLLTEALSKGYNVFARVEPSIKNEVEGVSDVDMSIRRMKQLLDVYDYAWNIEVGKEAARQVIK